LRQAKGDSSADYPINQIYTRGASYSFTPDIGDFLGERSVRFTRHSSDACSFVRLLSGTGLILVRAPRRFRSHLYSDLCGGFFSLLARTLLIGNIHKKVAYQIEE
jgi:hypothetical protein